MKSQSKSKALQKIALSILQHLSLLALIAGLSWSVFKLYPEAHQKEEKIQIQKKQEILKFFFTSVLPAFDNEPWKEKVQQGNHTFYVARNNAAAPKLYQITPSLLATPDLKTEPKQTHIVGFAWLMSDESATRQFLLGSDLEGNILIQDVSRSKKIESEASIHIQEKLKAEAKELMAGHRDLLMLQLEPEETVPHA